MNKFNICEKCDFEWHSNDGPNCPVCQSGSTHEETERMGGVFGKGRHAARMKVWFKALGLIALVYFIYQILP